MSSCLRFYVGDDPGPRSAAWKVWTHRNDIYLQARLMGAHMKVSLHESGACQYSRSSVWVTETGARNQDRHLERWEMAPPRAPDVSIHVFRVIFPEGELSMHLPEEPLANFIRIPAAPVGFGKYVELFLTPPLSQPFDPAHAPFDHVGTLTRADRRYVVVSVQTLEVLPEDREQLARLRTALLSRVPSDPRSRGWALAEKDEFHKSIVEFSLVGDV